MEGVALLKWIIGLSVLAGVLTFVVTPYIRRLATRNGLVDCPDYRKNHACPTPACGGLAVFIGLLPMFFGLLTASLLDGTGFTSEHFLKVATLFAACGWILFLGIWDDRKGIKWSTKLAGQVLGVAILAVGGHFIKSVTLPFFGAVTLGWFGIVVFGCLLIVITNAINLIDGLDGLAVGICLFAGIAGGCTALVKGDPLVAVLQFSLVGALAGFLPYNWPPARVFLGDGGSMMLGFYLGTLAMSSAAVSTAGQRSAMFTALVAPFLPFSIALFDVGLAVVRRWVRGRKIYLPDTEHLHHRLSKAFKSPVRVIIVVYTFSAILAGMTVLAAASPSIASTPFIPIAGVMVLMGLTVMLLRTYRMDTLHHLPQVLAERRHFRFLDCWSDFMTARLARTHSVGECVSLLESGVRDLEFDAVLVYHGDTLVGKWENLAPVHRGGPRSALVDQISAGGLLVKAIVPHHERASYNVTLKASWCGFTAAWGKRLEEMGRTRELALELETLDLGVPGRSPLLDASSWH
ncbi:MAG: MraY family glycosyltransferase [Pseudomonadota bacterium]